MIYDNTVQLIVYVFFMYFICRCSHFLDIHFDCVETVIYDNTVHACTNNGRSQPWLSLAPLNVIGMVVFELLTQSHNYRDGP